MAQSYGNAGQSQALTLPSPIRRDLVQPDDQPMQVRLVIQSVEAGGQV
ncbi:hypothetical protein [uncultured Thiohalocapsa sp.]|nr:hypothetical protein [uncultured Thiohalocapsa sp.]